MTTDPREARLRLGLTLEQMGQMLGYDGPHTRSQMHRIESGERPLMPCQARLLKAYLDGYRPDDWPA